MEHEVAFFHDNSVFCVDMVTPSTSNQRSYVSQEVNQ